MRVDGFEGVLRVAALEAGGAVAELEPLLFAHRLVTIAILQNAEFAGYARGWVRGCAAILDKADMTSLSAVGQTSGGLPSSRGSLYVVPEVYLSPALNAIDYAHKYVGCV